MYINNTQTNLNNNKYYIQNLKFNMKNKYHSLK